MDTTNDILLVDQADAAKRIWRLMGSLDVREQAVIRRRFGLCGDRDTLAAIGRDLGLTRERVRQIEAKAMRKLMRAAKQ